MYKSLIIGRKGDLTELDQETVGAFARRNRLDFILQDRSRSDSALTQGFLEQLAPDKYTLKELAHVRENLGSYVARYLRQAAMQGYGKVLLSEGPCLGLLSSSLSTAPDALQFMAGAITTGTERDLETFHGSGKDRRYGSPLAEHISAVILDRVHRRDIPAELLLTISGSTAANDNNWIQLHISRAEKKVSGSYMVSAGSEGLAEAERSQWIREMAAIAALHQLGLWVVGELGKPNPKLRLHSPENLKILATLEDPYLADLIDHTQQVCQRTWGKIAPLMRAIAHPGLILGESFTRGLLSQLVNTPVGGIPGQARHSYFFYDEALKRDAGVAAENLSANRIAATPTALDAAERLLAKSPSRGQSAIVTTGFSNRPPFDEFSIAVHDLFNGHERHNALSVRVDVTADLPVSNARKQFCSWLGVCASLMLLSDSLYRRDPGNAVLRDFRPIATQLRRHLKQFCTLQNTDQALHSRKKMISLV